MPNCAPILAARPIRMARRSACAVRGAGTLAWPACAARTYAGAATHEVLAALEVARRSRGRDDTPLTTVWMVDWERLWIVSKVICRECRCLGKGCQQAVAS